MPDTQYEDLLRHVLDTGARKADRTGTGTRSIFGHQLRYRLSDGFPLVTTKKVALPLDRLRAAVVPARRVERDVAAGERRHDLGRVGGADGELGPVYGVQWRSWPTPDGGHVDQISEVLRALRENPDSRRIIVSAWNVGDIPKMALPPCHAFFQFYVADGKLSCQLYQRSADLFLGVPFNIASYALLTHMIAEQVGLRVGDFVWTGGDCHIYDNHEEQVRTQLSREARPFPTLDPEAGRQPVRLRLRGLRDRRLRPAPGIKAPVAV